jgi:hypothetical protein
LIAFLGEQLGQKIYKHGDFAGLAAGCRPHGADRNFSPFMIAQDAPHGPGAYVRRKVPVRRLGDAEAGENGGAELLAVIATKGRRRLMGNLAGTAGAYPGSRAVLRDENHAIMAVEIARPLGLSFAFQIVQTLRW